MNLKKVLITIFAICMAISLFGGFAIFVLHIIGLVVGAEQGAAIMTFASSDIKDLLIQISSIGVVIGLILLYLTNAHTLTYHSEKKQ